MVAQHAVLVRLLLSTFLFMLVCPSVALADRVVVIPPGGGGDEIGHAVKDEILNAATSELNQAGHTVVSDTERDV